MWIGILVLLTLACWAAIRAKGKRSKPKLPRAASTTSLSNKPPEPIAAPSSSAQRPGESSGIRWYGRGAVLEVAGFRLKSPDVYASPGKRGSYNWATDPSEILIHAEVRRPTTSLPDMGYWPWYSRISPEHRYQYIDWLASGKNRLPLTDGFLFLYFYGLERRMLVDQQDREWVLQEIVRLRKLDEPRRGTREGRSFRLYSSALLWYEVARAPELFNERSFGLTCDLTEAWNEAVIPAPLSWLARHNRPVSANLALRVARVNPRAIQSVVTKRVGEQFAELFRKRYTEKFGTGLLVRAPDRSRRYTYRPASGGLEVAACSLRDPTELPQQFEPLGELWNQCVTDLRGLARVAVDMKGPLTVQAWEAMPEELREGVDHPLAASVQGVLQSARQNASAPNQHATLVNVGAIGKLFGLEERGKLTATQSRKVADLVEHAGFAIEPDVRVTARPYGWNEQVAVFLPTDSSKPDPSRYLGAACLLQFGLVVAEADGVVDPEELQRLSEQIDAVFQLPANEMQRLDALRTVLLTSGADLNAVSKRIEAVLTSDARRQTGRLLVAIAAASGKIDRKELTALRKCFRALGLPPQQLDETVAQIVPDVGADFVTVAAAAPGSAGEPIPPRAGLQLNRAAISAILAETREVAVMLAGAMAEEPSPDASDERVSPSTTSFAAEARSASVGPVAATLEASPGLQERYAPFWKALRARPSWRREEAVVLAREHGLMLDGAIEAINEWALESVSAPLIDESDGVLMIDLTPR